LVATTPHVPGLGLGKRAVHVDLRMDHQGQRGRQLLRHELETIVSVADIGGGKVTVVDADNERLVDVYVRNGVRPRGRECDLTLDVKVSTVRKPMQH
jgi:hypothetical protein